MVVFVEISEGIFPRGFAKFRGRYLAKPSGKWSANTMHKVSSPLKEVGKTPHGLTASCWPLENSYGSFCTRYSGQFQQRILATSSEDT